MSYSRSRTYEKKRARQARRVRRLLLLNLSLLALIAIAAIWLLTGQNFERPGHGSNAAVHPAGGDADRGGQDAERGESGEGQAADGGDTRNGQTTEDGKAQEGHAVGEGAGGRAAGGGEATDGPGADGEDEDELTLAFVGDLLPAGSVARLMAKNGYDYPYREARSLLESADITAGNLETAITDRGTPEDNKQYLFRGPKEALPALREAGFDVLNLANNHTLDYGWDGLQDTMDALDLHGLRHMGAGADVHRAFEPVYVEAKGMTVAYIGATNVVPKVSWKAGPKQPGLAELYNPAYAVEAVKAAKEKADLVVVMVHWGVERADQPINEQIVKGRKLIDAGADLIIGSHPHVLQGFESYNGKWIAYSLGNFVFNTTASPRTSETGVLTASCRKDGSCRLRFHPMQARNSQPSPMDDEAGQALLSRLRALSATADVEVNGQIVEKR
jgi:poly-gamma-glutamate synthesis protein (capsule biosynthesis protein)